MPKIKYVPDSVCPYHISARCINKEWFEIPLDQVWEIMSNYLYFLKLGFNFEIINFVLMSNHFHMIALTPEANLCEGMNYFMRETSRCITYSCGRINQTYGAPYHKSLIKTTSYFRHAYKYVYRNPVEAGLCLKVEDYKYSTLRAKIDMEKTIIPFCEDHLLFESPVETLKWLNTNYPDLNTKNLIRTALKKPLFEIAKNRHGQKSELENKII